MFYAIFEDIVGSTASRPIIRVLSVADEAAAILNTNVGELRIEVSNFYSPDNYYITWSGTAFVLTARPLLSTVATWDVTTIVANGVAAATFGPSLPNPTEILVTNVPNFAGAFFPRVVSSTTGSLVLKTAVPGDYKFSITKFPYVSQEYTITATAPV